MSTDHIDKFVTYLSNSELKQQFPLLHEKTEPWRRYTRAVGNLDFFIANVRGGFTLKKFVSLSGVQLPDEMDSGDPTEDCIVFWVPSLAPDSTMKYFADMESHRNNLAKEHGLPLGHASSFGSASLLFALILAHFRRTGLMVPTGKKFAVSDTLQKGYRCYVGGFHRDGVKCDRFRNLSPDVKYGFFLLGVEKI